jgi:hypothetical protein
MSQTYTGLSHPTFTALGGPAAVEYRARGLLVALHRAPSSLDRSIPAGFDRLLNFAESLPLASADFPIVRNWINGARVLWKQGESRAALYQLKMACRKLHIAE